MTPLYRALKAPTRLQGRSAFTLIELLVVILIIAVLIAVAAPSFLGQTHKAQESAAKQALAVAYRAAKADAVDREGQWGAASALADALQDSEPQLNFQSSGQYPFTVETSGRRNLNVAVSGSQLELRARAADDRVCQLTALENGAPSLACIVVGPPPVPPSNISLPEIDDDTPQEGQTLTASTGVWAGDGPFTFSYQWQRCDLLGGNCLDLTTGPTYLVDDLDVGSALRVVVTAENVAAAVAAVSLTTEEVTSAYRAVVLEDSPLAYWRLAETSGTTAKTQVSSPSLDGVYTCTGSGCTPPTLGQPGALQASQNKAVAFASAQHVDVSAAVAGSPFTVEVWAYFDAASMGRRVVLASNRAAGKGFSLEKTAQDGLQLVLNNTASLYNVIVESGRWYHLVATYDGAQEQVYVNGVVAASASTLAYTPQDAALLRLGAETNVAPSATTSLDGRLDEVAVYAAALGSARVAAHSDAGRDPDVAAPVNTSLPVVSGTVQVGQTLSVSAGSWTGAGSFVDDIYWQRCDAAGANCVDIAGARARSYTVGSADSDSTLRARLVATNRAGSTSQQSAATVVVPRQDYEALVEAEASLLGYWRLGEASGLTAFDEKSLNPGTYSCSGSSCSPAVLAQPAPWSGATNTSIGLYQDTTSNRAQYVNIPYAASLNTASFSVEAWVKFDAASMGKLTYIVSTYGATSGAGRGFYLQKDAADKIKLTLANGTGSVFSTSISTTSAAQAGVWYHVVATYSDATKAGRVWLNGVGQTATSFSTSFATNSYAPQTSYPLRFSARADTTSSSAMVIDGFQGYLDEVAVYSSVLSQAAIVDHYRAYKP